MVRLIYIIGLVLLVFSCNSKRNKIFELSKDELVKGIAEESIIAGSAVGIGGIESDQWRRFLALRAKTNEQDLIDLTNHSNNAVKSYAFMALAETKSEAIFPVLLKNISDTGKVQTFYGCLRGSLTVAEFYIQEAVSGEHLNQISILANANYNTPVESEEKYLAALYEALVQYKNHPSKDILKETIHQSTGMDSIKKIDLVYGALKKYPDSIYRNVIQYF